MNIEENAIEGVRDFLIALLRQKEWCQARQIGKALELLVEGRRRPERTETGQGDMFAAPGRIRTNEDKY